MEAFINMFWDAEILLYKQPVWTIGRIRKLQQINFLGLHIMIHTGAL